MDRTPILGPQERRIHMIDFVCSGCHAALQISEVDRMFGLCPPVVFPDLTRGIDEGRGFASLYLMR